MKNTYDFISSNLDKNNSKRYHYILIVIILLCFAFASVSVVLYAGVFKQIAISTESMFPTFKKGDRVTVNIFSYLFRDPKQGEIVVIRVRKNKYPGLEANKYYIRRIVGIPNDRIKIAPPYVYINGKKCLAPMFINHPTTTNKYTEYLRVPDTAFSKASAREEREMILKKDEYFALGDNAENAFDCRYYGPIHRDSIIACVTCRVK